LGDYDAALCTEDGAVGAAAVKTQDPGQVEGLVVYGGWCNDCLGHVVFSTTSLIVTVVFRGIELEVGACR
jgi:hypothetical protein